MAQTYEYKIVTGNGENAQKWLSEHATQGFKAVLLSSCVGTGPGEEVKVIIVMERPVATS